MEKITPHKLLEICQKTAADVDKTSKKFDHHQRQMDRWLIYINILLCVSWLCILGKIIVIIIQRWG